MMSATALAFRVVKARSIIFAVLARLKPGRSGTAAPITPENHTTGTTGVSERKRAGINGPSVSAITFMRSGIGAVAIRLGAAMTGSYATNVTESKARRNFRVFVFFTSGVAFAFNELTKWSWKLDWGDVMDPKLAMLIVLFGSIIGLSYLSAENLARLKRWRKTAP
jgi:hypothetical protein